MMKYIRPTQTSFIAYDFFYFGDVMMRLNLGEIANRGKSL